MSRVERLAKRLEKISGGGDAWVPAWLIAVGVDRILRRHQVPLKRERDLAEVKLVQACCRADG